MKNGFKEGRYRVQQCKLEGKAVDTVIVLVLLADIIRGIDSFYADQEFRDGTGNNQTSISGLAHQTCHWFRARRGLWLFSTAMSPNNVVACNFLCCLTAVGQANCGANSS